MDRFLTRKRRRSHETPDDGDGDIGTLVNTVQDDADDSDSTELKLATLASLHGGIPPEVLLDALLDADGDIKAATAALQPVKQADVRPTKRTIGHQSTLAVSCGSASKQLTRKGKTLYLYSPHDVETHSPCSIIHNFLPTDEANRLLVELLEETPTFRKETFKLFDRVVESPHTMAFYVDSLEEAKAQKTEYVYNGSTIADVRQTLPCMKQTAAKVQTGVNSEIARRISQVYPQRQKLRFQSPKEWTPNASFVNCYDGGKEKVGYHADQLTYLGPRAVIGSLSLGVAREFRVRRVVARHDEDADGDDQTTLAGDQQGQISIHLPHNSLLVMHAEMQEEWKHAIAGATAIDPHPIAGNKRINVTYRHYKASMHPRYTPRCHCGIATVLRCAMRKKESRGRYMWMCHASYTPGLTGCKFFEWAKFDDDGEPPWAV